MHKKMYRIIFTIHVDIVMSSYYIVRHAYAKEDYINFNCTHSRN